MEHPKSEANNQEIPSAEEMSRRRFLSYLTGLLGGVIALAAGLPLAGFVISPLLERKKELWAKLGPVSSLRPQQPVKFTYSYQRIDGWFEKTVHNTTYAVQLSQPEELIILSNICTHLGCGVWWDDKAEAFLCPCHDGRFDLQGKVLSGPPPKPLARLRWRIQKGEIFVRTEEV